MILIVFFYSEEKYYIFIVGPKNILIANCCTIGQSIIYY